LQVFAGVGFSPQENQLMKSARTSFLYFSALAGFAAFAGGWTAMDRVNRHGMQFFETGAAIVSQLNQVGHAIAKNDAAEFGLFFTDDYRGSALGLNSLSQLSVREGVEERRFESAATGSADVDRAAALAEWTHYLNSFESIESVELHLNRLTEWESPTHWAASVRFELIGKLNGAAFDGVDRALFNFEFHVIDGVPRISKASLIEGERIVNSGAEPGTNDAPPSRRQFADVSAAAGIDFKNQYYPAFLNQPLRFGMIRYGPGGISTTDYDNDSYYDLFIPDGVASRLYRNLSNGKFEDITARAGLSGLDGVSVGVFADYDNDGHKDLFVSRTFKPNNLFRSNGDGTFTDVTLKSGIGADCCATVASWADYNRDGYLDLYVGRYLDPRKDIPTTFYARNGEANQLYRNNGDGTFTNVTDEAGVGEVGLCLGTVWGDYNDDADPDLYVVNDFGRSTLYRNEGDGTFSDVTVRTNTLAYGAGMNASFADYDNDGRLDIYNTQIRSDHAWFAESPTVGRYMLNSWKQGVWKTDMPLYWEMFKQSGFGFVEVFQKMASGNTLLHNKGDGTFEDLSTRARANPPGWFWGASFADFDRDGWQDVYAANGWVYNQQGTEIEMDFLNNVVSKQDEYKTGKFFDPKHFGTTSWHGYERNRHLRNNGPDKDGIVTFTEIGRAAGTDLIANDRGVAVADFWNRGVFDIAVSASDDKHSLLRNELANDPSVAARHWLEVELIGTNSPRDPAGARITIHVNGKQQMRELTIGDGYGSQNSLRQYFGLNDAAHVDELTVRWPRSGKTQTFRNIEADRIIRITENDPQIAHIGPKN
jgi:hypothetical protein